MAAYPFTTFSEGSTAEPADGRVVQRATNGTAKVRVLFTTDKKAFNLQHRIKSADKSTLDTFYGSNRAISWTLVFDGGTSTCVFASPPVYQYRPGGIYLATVRAQEV